MGMSWRCMARFATCTIRSRCRRRDELHDIEQSFMHQIGISVIRAIYHISHVHALHMQQRYSSIMMGFTKY